MWNVPALQAQPWSEVQAQYEALRPSWVVATDCVYNAWLASEIVSVLFNKRRRALHDFIAGTVVIVDRPVRAAASPA